MPKPAALAATTTAIEMAWLAVGSKFVKHMGDGIFALFAGPADGVRAAYAIQEALRDFNQFHHNNIAMPFHTRTGITTGEVHVVYMDINGRRECEVMGQCVNLAARLQHITPVNGIALDRPTYTQCASLLRGTVSQTVLTLKDGAEPVYIIAPEGDDER